MNVYFDIDGTLRALDGRLRPHAREVIEDLVGAGHQVWFWSAGGAEYARENVARWELDHLAAGYAYRPYPPALDGVVSGRRRHGTAAHEAQALRDLPASPDLIVNDEDKEGYLYCVVVRSWWGGKDNGDLLRVPLAVALLEGWQDGPKAGVKEAV